MAIVTYTCNPIGGWAAVVEPEYRLQRTYFGSGNLLAQTAKKGSARSLSVTVNPAMNRVVGLKSDNNGNQASGTTPLYPKAQVYFGGMLVIGQGDRRLTIDRLGSTVRTEGYFQPEYRYRYYPYGEQQGGSTNEDQVKFGTYWRDSVSGLDYAQNRYFAASQGRFTSADPYVMSGEMGEPQGWNQYAYVAADPVNFDDPAGLQAQAPYPPGYCPAEFSYSECLSSGFLSSNGPGGDGGVGGGGRICTIGLGVLPSPLCMMPIIVLEPELEPEETDCGDPQALGWIRVHGTDASVIANQLGTSEADILGLSALESGWGPGPFVRPGSFTLPSGRVIRAPGGNNFFVLHALNGSPLPHSNGWNEIPGNGVKRGADGMASFASYFDSAKSFAATKGMYVSGVIDPTEFARRLNTRLAGFGRGKNGPNPNYVPTLVDIINKIARCL